jgi:hypothetical protein
MAAFLLLVVPMQLFFIGTGIGRHAPYIKLRLSFGNPCAEYHKAGLMPRLSCSLSATDDYKVSVVYFDCAKFKLSHNGIATRADHFLHCSHKLFFCQVWRSAISHQQLIFQIARLILDFPKIGPILLKLIMNVPFDTGFENCLFLCRKRGVRIWRCLCSCECCTYRTNYNKRQPRTFHSTDTSSPYHEKHLRAA